MDLTQIARLIDLLALAFVVGATSWFFFVQSPTLLARMGREKFVPLQMRLTVVLFRALSVALFVIAGATVVHSAALSTAAASAAIALAGGLINKYVVVPRALKAGGRSRAEIKNKDDEASVGGFASEGAGNRTRLMHRLVVLFVVVMLGGAVVHGATLLGL